VPVSLPEKYIATVFTTSSVLSGFFTAATCDFKRKFRLYQKEMILASSKDKL